MKAKEVVSTVGKFIKRNTPSILTGLSVAGVIGTAIMAVQVTPEAHYILEEMGYFDGTVTKKEAFKAVWTLYIPSAVMGGVTCGCIIAANSINLKRNAALAGLYSISEATLKEYQNKVIDTIGKNKERKIRDNIAQDTINKIPVNDAGVYMTGQGDTLCFDKMSGRYFKSDIEKIRKAQNDINQQIIGDCSASLNEFYYMLGLPGIEIGDEVGWSVDNMVDVDFSAVLSDGAPVMVNMPTNGTPCLVMDFKNRPTFLYRDY